MLSFSFFGHLVAIDANFYAERVLPALNTGLWVSLQLILPAITLGFAGGVLLGVTRVYAPCNMRRLADWFTTLVRGTPLVIQLLLIYNCLPKVGMGLDSFATYCTQILPPGLHYHGEVFQQTCLLEPFSAALIGFIICSGAYQSEYIRGALLSISQGQIKAAQALGFSSPRLIWHIVVPQALRRALPSCGNEFIYLIKYSSLAYVISCIELTGEANVLAGRTYRYLEIYLLVGGYYLAMTTFAAFLLHRLEKRFAIPGFTRDTLI